MTDSAPVIPGISLPPLVPTHRGPRVWSVFVVFITVLLTSFLVTIAVMVAAMAIMHVSPDQSAQFDARDLLINPRVLLPMAMGSQLVILGAVAGACFLSRAPTVQRLRLGPSNASLISIVIFSLGAVGLSEFFSASVSVLGWESGNLKYINDAMNNLTPKLLPIAIIVVGILPGVAEELLCRGYIQTRLSQRWGRSLSILITAVLFAVLHMDPLQSLFTFGLGLYLGVITERTGSIRPAMIAHIANNTLAVLTASVASERLAPHIGIVLIVSFLLLIGAVAYLLKFFPSKSAPPLPPAPPETVPAAFPALIPSPISQVPSASPPPLV